MKKLILKSALLLATTLALPMSAHANPIVINGGFETGDFTGWEYTTWQGSSNVCSIGCVPVPKSGNSYALLATTPVNSFDPLRSTASLSQSFSLTPGQVYSVSFWQSEIFWVVGSYLRAYWNQTLVFQDEINTLPDLDLGKIYMAYSDEYDYPFQQFSFNVVGSEDGFMGWGFDNLTFELSAPFDHFQTQCFCQIDPQISLIAIDEVFISPIPEPETYALMLAGLAVVGAAAKRRRAQ